MRRRPSLKSAAGDDLDLSYFVEWRHHLWTPAVEYLIDNPTRFAGKTVLDIGCRHGRMSCLFGLLGATVVGVDMVGVPMKKAWEEVGRWNLSDRVSFVSYDGSAENIPGEDYDYMFTKSVLVVVPELDTFLLGLASKLKTGGELIAAENLAGGYLLFLARRLWTYKRYSGLEDGFHGVDERFLARVNRAFTVIGVQTYYGSVAAIRARKK